jgi:hypothetical protein
MSGTTRCVARSSGGSSEREMEWLEKQPKRQLMMTERTTWRFCGPLKTAFKSWLNPPLKVTSQRSQQPANWRIVKNVTLENIWRCSKDRPDHRFDSFKLDGTGQDFQMNLKQSSLE